MNVQIAELANLRGGGRKTGFKSQSVITFREGTVAEELIVMTINVASGGPRKLFTVQKDTEGTRFGHTRHTESHEPAGIGSSGVKRNEVRSASQVVPHVVL